MWNETIHHMQEVHSSKIKSVEIDQDSIGLKLLVNYIKDCKMSVN